MVVRVLYHCDVCQGDVRWAEAAFLVEDGAHVFVGREKTLHQDVAFAAVDEVACQCSSLNVVGLLDDSELLDVDVFCLAYLRDTSLVTDEGGIDKTVVNSIVDSANSVVVHSESRHETFLRTALQHVEHFI